MLDLPSLFQKLISSTGSGRFEEALLQSPLGDACLSAHPLGFRVARIDQDPLALRLHLWSGASTEQPGYETHDHMFDLVSHVVQGCIHQQTYEFIADPAGPQAIYTVTYQHGHSTIGRTDQRGRLELVRDEYFEAGATYRLEAGRLHVAKSHGAMPSITLALTTQRLGTVRTIGPYNGERTLQSSRTYLDDRPLRELGLDRAQMISTSPSIEV